MCAMTRMRLTLAPQPHPLGDRRPHVVAPYHRFDDWVAGWPNRPHIVRHLIAPHRWVRTVVIPDAKRPRRSGASFLAFRLGKWWRGQDLNLRPSGYEITDRDLRRYRPVPDSALELAFLGPHYIGRAVSCPPR